MSVALLRLDAIRTDCGTQPRAYLDAFAVAKYANAMAAGEKLPPIVVFYDGTSHILADGFHRHAAAEMILAGEIAADVRQGTIRDAILHSVGANADNGMIRTAEDERRAVRRLLEDEEWGQWSNYKIAQWCKVSHDMVRDMRAELAPPILTGERQYRTFTHPKTGRPTRMDVTDIGRRRNGDEEDTPEPRAGGGVGVRERDVKDRVFAYAEAIRALRAAFRVLPSEPELLAARLRDLDADEIGRWAMYLSDLEAELRERQERVA